MGRMTQRLKVERRDGRTLRRIESVAVEVEAKTRPDLRKRRTYAPARDAFLENSAMRREMYRL